MKQRSVLYPLLSVNQEEQPLVLERGEGVWLFGSGGRRWLDLNSGLWNVPLGYGDPALTEAVAEQAGRLSYINMLTASCPPLMDYADQLLAFTGHDFQKVIYTCSGSESVECAIKAARKYMVLTGHPEKHWVLSMDMSYHGTTYAAMAASGMDGMETDEYRPLPGAIDFLETPFFPDREPTEEEKEALLEVMRSRLREGDVAAVLLEPVIASGGVVPLPAWYLEALFAAVEDSGALLIADEVATGFFRTGPRYCYETFSRKPDLLCLSKAITNGMLPMGAVLVGQRVLQAYREKNEYLNHFSTQCGNPIACACASAVLTALEEESLQENIRARAAQIRRGLEALEHPQLRAVRSQGMMFALDLTDSAGGPLPQRELNLLMELCCARGLLPYLFACGQKTTGLMLMPPYRLTEEEAARALRQLAEVLMLWGE